MLANKDKGTSVGFTDSLPFSGYMHVNCREGECEFIEVEMTASYHDSESETINKFKVCRFCGKLDPSIDLNGDAKTVIATDGEKFNWDEDRFHKKENLNVISDNEWEDIWIEFKNEGGVVFKLDFYNWIKEKYFAPDKKNT